MAKIRPKILLRYGRINQPIRVPVIDLLVDALSSYLTADTAAGSGSLTVKNIAGFAINQILLIGDPDNEGSEIIKTHAATAPTGSTVTLASNTVLPHSSSTKITILAYDQVEISNAPTVAGVKSVLATVSIDPTSEVTEYNDSASSSGYYFARFYNSIGAGSFSVYSDPAPYGGYTQLSARKLIDAALAGINKTTSKVLSDELAFMELDNFQTEVLEEQKRWSFMQTFDANIGVTATGQWRVAMPTDVDDQNTNRSIWNLKIGRQSNLTWIDKEKWNDITVDVAHTTLAVNIIVGALTITLTDSNDFDVNGGVIQIGANLYTYTANDQVTNVLTLSTASTTTNTAGEDVFFGASQGEPIYWTTFGGYVYFYPIISSTYNGRNIFMDYYKKATPITTDSDVIIVPSPTAAIYYLQEKFLIALNNGEESNSSIVKHQKFEARKENIKRKDSIGRTYMLKPRLNTLRQENAFEQDSKQTRLGNFPNS